MAKPKKNRRQRKRESRGEAGPQEAKRARYEPVEAEGGVDSDIIIDSDGECSPSMANGSTSSVYMQQNPLCHAKWCSEKNLPEDYEKGMLGVEYCGIQRVFTLVEDTRKRFPNECDELDTAIWNHFKRNGQNREVYEWKMQVRDVLLQELRLMFSEQTVRLFAVGSTMNGCGSFNSDMDLCLCLPDLGNPGEFCTQRNKTMKYLYKIQNMTRRVSRVRHLVRSTQVIAAKVPIIKVDLHPPYAELDLDININNIAGVYNSHLIHYYSRLDLRFPAICLLVKHWAIRNDISDAMNGTFNSYSLILLVLHYLQAGVKPAVMPNLQYLFPDLFSNTVPIDDLELFRELEGLPERPLNRMTIGDLFMGFFHYYDNFDFGTWAISIRSGKKFPRTSLQPADSRFFIFVEEPFDKINTARCVTMDGCFRQIKTCIKAASAAFSKGAPTLAKIGVRV